MKTDSFLLVVLTLASSTFLGCHESSSPTAPGPPSPGHGPAIFGEVLSASDQRPIQDVRVTIEGYGFGPTDHNGRYRFDTIRLPAGTYQISAKIEGFQISRASVFLDQESIRQDFVLIRGQAPEYFLVGTVWVSGEEGVRAHQSAKVELLDGPQAGLTTHLDEGWYGFHDLPPGTIQVRASVGDFSQTRTVELTGSQVRVTLDFSL